MIVQIYFGFAHNSNTTKLELQRCKERYHLKCAQVKYVQYIIRFIILLRKVTYFFMRY